MANENPESVCDCRPIERRVAGPGTIDDRMDTVLRIAETAALTHWAGHWRDSLTINNSTVRGQCGEEYTVEVDFDGTLHGNLAESFETEHGTARIRSMRGSGKVSIGVTIS